MGKWDSFTKRLIGLRPWQYASWLLSGAVFVETLNLELKAQFKRSFSMFQDIMKDSWVYQEIVHESEERGQTKGQAKGIQSHRQAILDIVSKRFPLFNELAFQQVSHMSDLDALRTLIVNISVENSEEAVRKLLMDAITDEGRD